MALLSNVHFGLNNPTTSPERKVHITSGYEYYHYKCHGYDDVRWGCGYRTLQTIASHLSLQQGKAGQVPTIIEIQQTLVELADKEQSFVKSREWIGSFEVCLVIEKLFDVCFKILHCPSGGNGMINIFPKLEEHLANSSSAPPIMMGGDRDASSKGILGTCAADDDRWLLVLDPHYQGGQTSAAKLQSEGYIRWTHLNEFDKQSFYNVCLPQLSKVLCTI